MEFRLGNTDGLRFDKFASDAEDKRSGNQDIRKESKSWKSLTLR